MYDAPRFSLMFQKAGTWTSADQSFGIVNPKGRKGRLLDYGFWAVTTAHAGATNTPKVEVGITGTLAKYGVAFDGGALSVATGMVSVRSTYDKLSDVQTYILETSDANYGELPDDTTVPILLTVIAATGGGAAGASTAFALINWGA